MDRFRQLLPALLLAALGGGLYGAAEALSVPVEGRLWIEHPAGLVAFGFATGALLIALPGALVALAGKGRLRGLAGAAAAVSAIELAMMFVTDPPPFQDPPWWMHNPALLGGGLLGTVALVALSRRVQLVGQAWILGLMALPLASAAAGRSGGAESSGDAPNLLLITMDTTRADHLHAYGHKRIATPATDRLAAEGVLFERAYSQIAVTAPSHTTVMSGRGTWSHGTLLNGIPVSEDQSLLAELLSERGYRTGAFVSAYVLDHKMGFDRGFATYDDDFSSLEGSSGLLAGRLWAGLVRHFSPDTVLERVGGDTVDSALSWLEAAPADRPWFLWVHLFDAHGPYEPPPPYDTMYYQGDPRDPSNKSMERVDHVAAYLESSLEGITDLNWVIAQYDGEISYADAQVGRLLDALDERGEAGDTLVVLAGDHGESLGENGVWFNHGDDVFDASTHVPLIMRWPGEVPAGQRVGGIVELTDVAPTVHALLGLEVAGPLDGHSLVPTWTRGESREAARSLIFDREANIADREAGISAKPRWLMAGLRSDEALYVHRDHEDFYDALYENDRPEVDVIKAWYEDGVKRERIDAYKKVAAALIEVSAAGVERSGQEVSAEARRKLEELGYIE